jgi:hypothetical protein
LPALGSLPSSSTGNPSFFSCHQIKLLASLRRRGLSPMTCLASNSVGEGCSFDSFVSKYGLDNDPAIVTIAAIVRGADTDRHDLTPQSAGLLAISMGLRDLSPNDHEVLKRGFIMYDALYAWALHRTTETHRWPPVWSPKRRDGVCKRGQSLDSSGCYIQANVCFWH